MRRFLDWTTSQTSSQSLVGSNRRNSQQLQQPQQHQQANQLHSQQSLQLQQQQPPSPNPARDLELHHLTKLLHEIKYYQASSSPLPSVSSSQNQREFLEKVHRTLPLFLNVFGVTSVSSSGSVFTLVAEGSSRSSVDQSDNPSESTTASSSPLPQNRHPQMELFPDLLPFAFTIARLFVSEVRQRASNKHAEDASLAILHFLNNKNPNIGDKNQSNQLDESSTATTTTTSSDEISRGWNLLLSLNTLALSQSSQIIQLLCDASLPSTLIKCLYLFFDLPATTTKPSETQQDESQNTSDINSGKSYDSNILNNHHTNASLIKAFTQLLVQLCSNQAAIDELIKKDDLRLLIGIASSQCQSHNKAWRKTAFQTLLAISKTMRNNFMYLEQNLCIQVYIENLHRINSLDLVSNDELIDMMKTLLEFLYNLDVNNRNQPKCIAPLIEQFKTSRFVELVEALILTIDELIAQEQATSATDKEHKNQHSSVSSELNIKLDEYRKQARKLIQSLTTMAKINMSQEAMLDITTLKPLAMSRFDMLDQFKMPKPSAKNCILNSEVLRLLKMVWSKCQDIHLTEAALDATISLFNDDKYNYFVFEHHQLLVYFMTSYNFYQFSFRLKQKLFKFLEFIIIETNYIPCVELGTIGTMIKKKSTSSMDVVLGLRTLIACLKYNRKFSDIFREIGLLEVIIELLSETVQLENMNLEQIDILCLLLESSQHLLAGPNNQNCTQFNESGAARHVFNCISKPEFFQLLIPEHSLSTEEGSTGIVSSAPPLRTDCATPFSVQTRHQYPTALLFDNPSNIHIYSQKPSFKQLQRVAFNIIRQIILSSVGDEHLANLLGLLAKNLDDLKNLDSSEETRKEGEFNDASNDRPSIRPIRKTFAILVSQEINLKICILKSLMIILKDSHRCRTLFRKAGGFVYIVSSLVTLEKALSVDSLEKEVNNKWRDVNSRRIWRLIKNSIITIVVAMRFEPANLRAFSEDVMADFTESIRKLGCFRLEQRSLEQKSSPQNIMSENLTTYKSIFLAPPTRDFSTIPHDINDRSEACCQIFRFLYDMSLDMGDGTAELEDDLERVDSMQKLNQDGIFDTKSVSFDHGSTHMNFPSMDSSCVFKRRSHLHMAPKRPPSLDLNQRGTERALLTFPCVILSILDLVPSCPNDELMVFICLVIKSLFKHERNQQMLCEAGMISKLLSSDWQTAIVDKNHFLHDLIQFMFEKLTRQAINPKELRMFLRLGNPLKCKNLDEIEVHESSEETRQKLSDSSKKESSTIVPAVQKEKLSTNLIETFVSMISNERSKIQPPFVEFDLKTEGLSFIFMPSIAPINAKSLSQNATSFLNSTLDIHTNEKNGILGGVGTVERLFPPITGLTFSSWICVEKFPSRSSDANHNIRLLTIYRGSAATGKEYSCFRVQISALDRALTVSTQETLLFDNDNRSEGNQDMDFNLRIWTPELLVEGKWHHIAITINRCALKQSTIYVYIDGTQVHHQRICYISSMVGVTNAGPLGYSGSSGTGSSAAAFVNAFIGSLPQFRNQLKTRWKQGPYHLFEEPLSSTFISVIHALGPDYIGNFQSPQKLPAILKSKHINKSSYETKTDQQGDASKHRSVTHQQSTVINSAHVHHQLTRVSSSTVATQSTQSSLAQTTINHQINSNHYVIAEDRVIIGVDSRAATLMTLSRMRRIYTRFDCRQIGRVLGLALHENSTPILVLHNTGVHLNGPSRSMGAITIGHNHVRCFVPQPTQQSLVNIGGSYIMLGFIAQAQTIEAFLISLQSLVSALKYNEKLQVQMDNINGYQMLSVMFWKKKHLLNSRVLKLTFSLVTDNIKTRSSSQRNSNLEIYRPTAIRDLICECFDLWLQTGHIDIVLEFIYNLISSTGDDQSSNTNQIVGSSLNSRTRNLKCLRDLDLLPRMLRLLPQYQETDSSSSGLIIEEVKCSQRRDNQTNDANLFDAKAVYLIKQIVFELLNRTPRQSDLLYFGQFLASLLPSTTQERPEQTINLRNILLKSLLQMMTRNKQKEVNEAVQEELTRILGFDWFMLFIGKPHLNKETIYVGLLNLLIILSNEELYKNFKSGTNTNGGWLKEPIFPTMDGKFNIQLLGINVGLFFGFSGKKKSIKQDVLEAPNFFILSNYLVNLARIPHIYLMLFQTIMGGFVQLDSSILDSISTFDKLNLDILCDSLVGDTHHKRRQTLGSIQFRCHELVICLVYMLQNIMRQYDLESNADQEQSSVDEAEESKRNYPNDVTRFLMYLYNNNQEFQQFCRNSDELIDALCETLMQSPDTSYDASKDKPYLRQMTSHSASKELLELSRLIILDTMTDSSQAV